MIQIQNQEGETVGTVEFDPFRAEYQGDNPLVRSFLKEIKTGVHETVALDGDNDGELIHPETTTELIGGELEERVRFTLASLGIRTTAVDGEEEQGNDG